MGPAEPPSGGFIMRVRPRNVTPIAVLVVTFVAGLVALAVTDRIVGSPVSGVLLAAGFIWMGVGSFLSNWVAVDDLEVTVRQFGRRPKTVVIERSKIAEVRLSRMSYQLRARDGSVLVRLGRSLFDADQVKALAAQLHVPAVDA